MSTPSANPDTTFDQLSSQPKDGKQANRAARLNVGAGLARRANDSAQSRDDRASANFVIIAEKVDVTNNFNF